MNKINQKGFTLVEGLLIVLVIAVLGIGGYLVWNKNQSKPAPATSQSSNSTASSNQSAKQNDQASVSVNELGVKVVINKPVDGLYYSVKDGQATFSTKELKDLDFDCSAEGQTAPAYLGYFTDPKASDPYAGTSTMEEAFPNALQVNDRYYYVSTAQGLCSNNSAVEAPFRDVISAFRNAKLEKL